jgi:hypothetical protein
MNLPAEDDLTARARTCIYLNNTTGKCCLVGFRKHTPKPDFLGVFVTTPFYKTLHTWWRSTNMYRSTKCQNTITASKDVIKNLLDFSTPIEKCEIYDPTVRTPLNRMGFIHSRIKGVGLRSCTANKYEGFKQTSKSGRAGCYSNISPVQNTNQMFVSTTLTTEMIGMTNRVNTQSYALIFIFLPKPKSPNWALSIYCTTFTILIAFPKMTSFSLLVSLINFTYKFGRFQQFYNILLRVYFLPSAVHFLHYY